MPGESTATPLSERAIQLLESEVLECRIRGVAVLDESVQSKAVRLHTEHGDFVLTQNIRGNSAPVEASLMRLVASRLPVPEPVYADNGELLGQPFVLKRFVPGRTVNAALSGVTRGEVCEIATAVGGTLAAIGAVVFEQPGQFTDIDLEPKPHPDFDLMTLPDHVRRRLDAPVMADYLDGTERTRLVDIVARDSAELNAVRTLAHLVHSDFNGKNIVIRRAERGWRVGAVLDWEFAFAGPPLVDIANHLRFPDELPESYRECFLTAFVDAGGILCEGWERIAGALDMFALVDFLAAGPQHMLFGKTLRHMQRIIARGHV